MYVCDMCACGLSKPIHHSIPKIVSMGFTASIVDEVLQREVVMNPHEKSRVQSLIICDVNGTGTGSPCSNAAGKGF